MVSWHNDDNDGNDDRRVPLTRTCDTSDRNDSYSLEHPFWSDDQRHRSDSAAIDAN